MKGEASVTEPYRARKDGARKGETYYVSPEMLKEVLRLCGAAEGEPVIHLDSAAGNVKPYGSSSNLFRNWLEVYKSASFFMVRDTEQVLLHSEPKKPDIRKLEIFGPVLAAILRSQAKDVMPFFRDSTTIFVHLNPLSQPLKDVNPDEVAKLAFANPKWNWESIQTKRNMIVRGKPLADDVAVRMALLPDEVRAWQELLALSQPRGQFHFVDCTEWDFFEARRLNEEYTLTDAVKRLLECVKEQAPNQVEFFRKVFPVQE